jgi:hypothetical protein
MKRWRDGGFEDESDRRDEVTPGPIEVQSLAQRGPLRRLALPFGIAFIVLIVVLARTTQLVTYFSGPSQTPASPTPTPTPGARPASTFSAAARGGRGLRPIPAGLGEPRRHDPLHDHPDQ